MTISTFPLDYPSFVLWNIIHSLIYNPCSPKINQMFLFIPSLLSFDNVFDLYHHVHMLPFFTYAIPPLSSRPVYDPHLPPRVTFTMSIFLLCLSFTFIPARYFETLYIACTSSVHNATHDVLQCLPAGIPKWEK